MQFLRFLESIRTGVGDFFFATVTHLGEETFFLALAIFFFWCVSKRQGYYILFTGLIGTVINQLLKILCRIPRPWIIDPNFKPVGAAIEEATGYSFPSGHTQNVAGTFGCIGRYNKQKWLKLACLTVIILVALSRMYLGVHTPLDVTVSLGIAAALVFGFYFVFRTDESTEKYMPWLLLASIVLSVAFILYVFLLPTSSFKTAADLANLASARKNAATLIGCLLGLSLIYPLDKYVIKFETKGRWYSQLIKLTIGVGIVLGIKIGLSKPLVSLFGNEYVARSVRYFLIVAFAGGVWPLTFKFFAQLRIAKLEQLTDWVKSKFTKKEASSPEA
jgi:undecaprenyl-diphosphatase